MDSEVDLKGEKKCFTWLDATVGCNLDATVLRRKLEFLLSDKSCNRKQQVGEAAAGVRLSGSVFGGDEPVFCSVTCLLIRDS